MVIPYLGMRMYTGIVSSIFLEFNKILSRDPREEDLWFNTKERREK